MNKIDKNYYILLMGGLNTRIGNQKIGKIITIKINGKNWQTSASLTDLE